MKIKSIIVALAALFIVPAEAGFSSSGKSSSGGFSRSSSAPSRPSYTPSKPSTPKSSWGSSGKNTQTPSSKAVSNFQTSQAQTPVKSKSDYVAEFKAKNQAKYETKFKEEPKARPEYIPHSYKDGGNTYNISYNRDQGGYGYMNALGTFILYDAITDAANNNYNRQVAYAPRSDNFSGWGIFWTILTCVLVFGIVIIIVNKL